MKRNWTLIQTLLLDLEADRLSQVNDPNQSPEHRYHALLLIQAGLACGVEHQSQGRSTCTLTGLTMEGHDFLSLARDPDRWNRAMVRSGGAVTLEILKEILKEDLLNAPATT